MSRKYRFAFHASVPDDVRKDSPEHLEAGPATISVKMGQFMQANPEYELTEDPDDYVVHVRKAKPVKGQHARE